MTPKVGNAEYQRQRRASDPSYAQRSREQSLAAKRRRKGVCERCGGVTRYNGHGSGTSRVCAGCNAQLNRDARRWTTETIVRAFRRFHAETGRVPRALDAQGTPESAMLRLSGRPSLEDAHHPRSRSRSSTRRHLSRSNDRSSQPALHPHCTLAWPHGTNGERTRA